MKMEYEKACKAAGLSEEKIREIRNVFETEKQKRRVNCKNREKYGYKEVSVEALIKAGFSTFSLTDETKDTYEEALYRIALSHLQRFLLRFTEEEQFMLLMYGVMSDREVAEKLNMSKSTMQYRRKRLLKQLREYFEKETNLI